MRCDFIKFGIHILGAFKILKLVANTDSKIIKVARNEGKFQTWEASCLKEGQKTFLKTLSNKGAISIVKEQRSSVELQVDSHRVCQVEKLLREREIKYDVTCKEGPSSMSPLTVPRYNSIKTKSSPIFNRSSKMNWSDYQPLNIIYNFMDSLEVQYPSTCTVTSIGKTAEGRDIKMLKISNSNAKNPGVWLDGGIHAREWISTAAVTYIANEIATNFDALPKSITSKDWYILPIVNPDGYHYSFYHDRLWRKNRSRFGNTIVGVDLNRNFGFYWGRKSGITDHQSNAGDPNHINYRGLEPFSEPETAAIKDIILYAANPFKIFLTFHSYSEVISFPWCHTAEPCADYVTLLEGGTLMAKAIYNVRGKMYKVGNFRDLMYSAYGTSIDWSYGTARIPFSYLLELPSREHKFILPKSEIISCSMEALNAVKALAEFVDLHDCHNYTVLANRLR